jgi:hypothetical protein
MEKNEQKLKNNKDEKELQQKQGKEIKVTKGLKKKMRVGDE